MVDDTWQVHRLMEIVENNMCKCVDLVDDMVVTWRGTTWKVLIGSWIFNVVALEVS